MINDISLKDTPRAKKSSLDHVRTELEKKSKTKELKERALDKPVF